MSIHALTLIEAFEHLRTAYRTDPVPSLTQRYAWLDRLTMLTERHGKEIGEAISTDFGYRSRHETELADLSMILASIKHTKRHLSRWMKPRKITTALPFFPAKNQLFSQPLGVIGIISPWNYPHQLAIGPAIAALAAGNRVMLKPSELTPCYSALLEKLISTYFSKEEMVVVSGDIEVGKRFSELPFDHLVFTGSTATGKKIALAAARNLTPVTLELGGKSPAIIDESADIKMAAKSLVFGKLLNAGQTCIAPDYLLVPEKKCKELVRELVTAGTKMYPSIVHNPDYSAIINTHHLARLQALITEAVKSGAQAIPLIGMETNIRPTENRKLTPFIILNATPDMRIMQEEIFGPFLPIMTYRDDIREAISFINQRERPLALYWYGRNQINRDLVLQQTVSGGVTVNGCLWHLSQESQPFGGVGASGMGAYHGKWGFRTLSKEKPVFYQSKMNGLSLLYPPYGKTFACILRLFKRIS